MSFSFKYKPIILKSGARLHRQLIPITLSGKENMDIIAILDSGSDITIIPKEIAEILKIKYNERENEISGIDGQPLKARQGSISCLFGKDRDSYNFDMPVLIPIDKENLSTIIGRVGFFDKFRITFRVKQKNRI